MDRHISAHCSVPAVRVEFLMKPNSRYFQDFFSLFVFAPFVSSACTHSPTPPLPWP